MFPIPDEEEHPIFQALTHEDEPFVEYSNMYQEDEEMAWVAGTRNLYLSGIDRLTS